MEENSSLFPKKNTVAVSRIILITLFLSFSNLSLSQTREIDSLIFLLERTPMDTSRVSILSQISLSFRRSDISQAKFYSRQALVLSNKLKYEKGIANCLYNLGTIYNQQSNKDSALLYLNKALRLMEKLDDEEGALKVYGNIGNVRYNQGDYSKALEHYQKVIQIAEARGEADKYGIALNNIGLVYQTLGSYSEALSYFYESLEAKESSGQLDYISSTYRNIGILNMQINQLDEARFYFDKSLKNDLLNNDKVGLAEDYLQIGSLLLSVDSVKNAILNFRESLAISSELIMPYEASRALGKIGYSHFMNDELDSALMYFKNSLAMMDSINEIISKPTIHLNLSKTYLRKKDYQKALENGFQGLDIAKKLGEKLTISNSHKILYEIYNELDNQSEALHHLSSHKTYSDSILNEVNLKKMANIESLFEIDKLKSENEVQSILLEKKQTEIFYQRILFGVTFIFVIFLVYSIIQISKKSSKLQRQKTEINLLNKDLEQLVMERTNQLNESIELISSHRSRLSHEFRAPLSNLSSILKLINRYEVGSERWEELIGLLKNNSDQIEQVTKSLNSLLEKGDSLKND